MRSGTSSAPHSGQCLAGGLRTRRGGELERPRHSPEGARSYTGLALHATARVRVQGASFLMKPLLVFGSTGSIGTQTLDVVRAHRGAFSVQGLAAERNWRALLEQALEFRPRF